MIYIAYDTVRQGTLISHGDTCLFVSDDSPLALRRSVRGLLGQDTGGGVLDVNFQTLGYFTELKMMLDHPENSPHKIEATFDMILFGFLNSARGIAASSILKI